MTAEQVLSSYPHCRVAVAYCELILDSGDDGDPEETSFDLMRQAQPPMSLEEVLACIKECLQGETACRAPEALVEMDHPEFQVYLRAKLGML